MKRDYYSILEISSLATTEEIKRAFRVQAIKYHPDKHFGDPVFIKKFIEVKEAYDTLIDLDKRREFDSMYKQSSSTIYSEVSNPNYTKKAEDEFKYTANKSFYDSLDREKQETPQNEPVTTPWGEEINGVFDFFALPQNIGRLIGGYSTLSKGAIEKTTKVSFWKTFFKVIKSSYLILPALIIILLLIWQKLYFSIDLKNATVIILIIFVVLSSIIIGLRISKHYASTPFEHLNYFIGVNGFAHFKCQDVRENIIFKEEINFNDVSDIVVRLIVDKKNPDYAFINYQFVWLNTKENKVVSQNTGTYTAIKAELIRFVYPEYWLQNEAEKYWTVYLLDNMEKELQQKGYLEFNLFLWDNYKYFPYIHLGIGFITFLDKKKNTTYRFSDIKRMYTKGTDLFIEHNNYEKILFFLNSGDRNSIPLENLCNRQFFIKATELLLGYSIV